MLSLRYARLWRLADALLLMLVLVAALLPSMLWPVRIDVDLGIGVDKLGHAVVFFCLAIWFAGQYRTAALWRVAVGLMAFGLLIEICQSVVGYRSAEWLDVAADAVGIALGIGVALLGAGGWSQRVESWYVGKTARAGLK